MKAGAPKSFATAGPESSRLRLITEGERFRWEIKPPGEKKAKSAPKKD
jgi:hypothetical protein